MNRKLLLIIGLLTLCSSLKAQDIVVNRLFNSTLTTAPTGKDDVVELLVIKDHLDLRGIYIKDCGSISATTNPLTEGGQYQFASHSLWSDLRAGTVIVLRREPSSATYTEDLDPADYILDIRLENTSLLTKVNTTTFNITNGDMLVLKSGTSADGFADIIHAFGVPSGSAHNPLIDAITAPRISTGTPSYSGSGPTYIVYPIMSSPPMIADFNTMVDAMVGRQMPSSAPDWGNGYGENNKSFIASLRAQSDGIPDVAINRVYNNGTTGDVVELLVLKDHTDMRGVYFKDINGQASTASSYNDTGAKYRFSENNLWKDLRIGTTITLRTVAAGITADGLDVDTAGRKLDINIIPTASSNYLTYISGPAFNLQNYDMVVLKKANATTGADGYDGAMHIFAFGVNTSYQAAYDALPEPKLGSNSLLATTTGYQYAALPNKSLRDFNGLGSVYVTNVTAAAAPNWGTGETGNNADFIASLRPVPTTEPPVIDFAGIVINRMLNSGLDNGEGDMMELLVIEDGTDIRGMYVKDVDGGSATSTSYNDNGGKYQFSQDPLWNNLKKGTTIVIRSVGPSVVDDGYDANASDSRIDVNLFFKKSSKYLNYISGTFNLQNYDMLVLKAAASAGGADGFEGSVHIFAAGVTASYQSAYNSLPLPKMASASLLSSASGYQFANSNTLSVNDFNGFETTVTNTTNTQTVWGDGEPGKNAQFITSLRPVANPVPAVAINRIFNSGLALGEEDIVELLVIKDHTDLRGAFFKDISGGTSSATSFNDNGGKYQFTQDALWSDLRAGTTIVLRAANSTVTEAAYDEDPADYRLDINLLYQKSSKYITYISGSFNLQNYDMVVLKGGSSANLYDNSIHIFAAGVNSSYLPAYDALPSPKLASTVFLNGNATSTGYQYAISTTQSTNDFNGRGTAFVGNSTTTAPVWGNGHPGSNADYITSLRPVVANQPVIRSDQDYVILENSPSGTVVGKAVANLASAGTLSNWAILYGNTNNMFAIDKATGIITLTGNAVPDFETLPVYYLTIEVYNGAIRSNSVQIIINVENMNEVPAAPGIFGMTAGKLNGFRPEVSGTAEYNSKIALYVDDVLVTDTITTTETRATWTHKITEAMSPGVHTFYFTATGIDNISLESPKTEVLMMLENFDIIANNILTPNGDGKNDTWIIKNLDLYPSNEVTVYDKLGKTVFSQKDYLQDWDGHSNGVLLNSGTYYYNINIGQGLKPIKGYITILRNN